MEMVTFATNLILFLDFYIHVHVSICCHTHSDQTAVVFAFATTNQIDDEQLRLSSGRKKK